MTFNKSTIPTSTMSKKNALVLFDDTLYSGYFNTIIGYFHTLEGYFADPITENSIPVSTLIKDHIPFDDLYWDSDIVNADHASDGILTLDEVYPPRGSEWDGCAAEWVFDGTYSVERAIPVSTSVRVTDNTDVNMVNNSINSSSFIEGSISSTVNMSNKHIADSTMVQRNANA